MPRRTKTWRRWTPEEDALLGTQPDVDIAARLDRTMESVQVRRAQRGIPPAPTETRASTTLTQTQVDEIRRRHARHGHVGRGRRLGTVTITLADMAAEYGVSKEAIRRVIVEDRPPRDRRRAQRRQIYDWSLVDHRLGKESDAAIARDMGCDEATVLHRRRKLGISPYRRHKVPR